MEKNKQQVSPATDEKMQEAFTQFQEKWDKMEVNERNGTLLNMVLSLSYRLDILASVVSNLSEVQEMENVAQEAVKKSTKTKENENGKSSK
jgi:hypothetical protein